MSTTALTRKPVRRTFAATLAAAVIGGGLGVATAQPASAATCSLSYTDTWVSGTDTAKFSTFYAPYYVGSKLYWKVFGMYQLSGPMARYDFSGAQAKRTGTTTWYGLSYGTFRYLGTVPNGGSLQVNFRIQKIDHQYNTWSWAYKTC